MPPGSTGFPEIPATSSETKKHHLQADVRLSSQCHHHPLLRSSSTPQPFKTCYHQVPLKTRIWNNIKSDKKSDSWSVERLIWFERKKSIKQNQLNIFFHFVPTSTNEWMSSKRSEEFLSQIPGNDLSWRCIMQPFRFQVLCAQRDEQYGVKQ